tara:strand:- start:1548 stop:2492 length:945 start_codon:yes stop_codon:yes gene_type:complete
MRIGISIGDINGIGPEVILKSLQHFKICDDIEFILFGCEETVRKQANAMNLPIYEKIRFVNVNKAEWSPGKVCLDSSVLAYEAIIAGINGSLNNDVDALVTAPIAKNGFKLAGINYPGHTEILAHLTKTDDFGMMLIGGGLRVMLATRHIPLSNVSRIISQEIIKKSIKLTYKGLKWLNIDNGKIGVCGLNPHAGDGGVLGNEENLIINPAIRSMQNKNILVNEAESADTIFYHALKGKYDAVIAMYHDQGLTPLKTLGFDEGVNLTLGLPIIRTSPDHGTAFGIAGMNKASENSMLKAIQLAIKLCKRDKQWL